MRRLILLALSAIVVVSACRDQSPTEPTVVPPQENLTTCRPVRFPLVRASVLIIKVFPPGRLRIEALARATAIALLWDTCKPNLARRGVADFVDFMNRNSGRLIGTQAQQTELISLMFTGVGLSAPPPITLGSDFGIGTVDPNATTPTQIENSSNTALIEFQPAAPGRPAAFNEVTIVTIFRHPDNFRLAGFPPEDQFPPFFDYAATNASGNHVVATGAVVRMAFCFLGVSSFPNGYPDGIRIGHNPAANVPGPRFEIIPADDPSDYFDDLVCNNLQTSLGGFGGGLMNFGRATGRLLGPLARAVFLPQPLMATVVGQRGPLGGLPPSLSDFGPVNATSYFGYETGEPTWSATGFWNRNTLTGVVNTAFPTYVSTVGNALPTPIRASFSGWYGQAVTGSYIGTQAAGDLPLSGGTSTAANSGAFLSTLLTVPDVDASVELRFKTWWEIEGVNPGFARANPQEGDPVGPFDVMDVILESGEGEVLLGQLNPEVDPSEPANRAALAYTSGGFNVAPVWVDETFDISDFKGEQVRIRFEFTTRDHQYNGFRGWAVDDVRISTGTSTPIILMAKQRSQRNLVPGRALPPASRP